MYEVAVKSIFSAKKIAGGLTRGASVAIMGDGNGDRAITIGETK